jgi:hypothetical protein
MIPRPRTIWPLVRLVFVITPLIYACLLSIYAENGFPTELRQAGFWPFLADKPVGEDGYYMLTVAWNFATKGAFEYNGDIHTTGIQPLAVVLYAALAKVTLAFGGGKEIFVRVVVAFGGLMDVAWAFAVGKTCEQVRERTARVADQPKAMDFAVMAALAYPAFRWFTYGLETGLYLLVFTCILYCLVRGEKVFRTKVPQLGLLAGLACLTRIDFAVVLIIAFTVTAARKQLQLTQLVRATTIAFLMLLPWLAYCYVTSGVPWPSSAGAQSELISLSSISGRFLAALTALLEQVIPWVSASTRPETACAALISALIAALYLSVTRSWNSLWAPLSRWPISNFAIALLVLAATYLAMIWATHFYSRYFILLSVITYVCVSAVLRTTRHAATLGTLCFILFVGQSFLAFHSGRIGNEHAIAAGAIDRKFPKDTPIGMFQSGVTGFYNPNVVNLDGKLDHEALYKLRSHRIMEYIAEKGIVAVCDWPGYLGERGMDLVKASGFARATIALTPYHVCYLSSDSLAIGR